MDETTMFEQQYEAYLQELEYINNGGCFTYGTEEYSEICAAEAERICGG